MIYPKEQLCSLCQTGKTTYELDKKEPMCPYINCYKNKKCPYFAETEEK